MGNLNYGTLAERVTALGAAPTAGRARPSKEMPPDFIHTHLVPHSLILSAAAGAPSRRRTGPVKSLLEMRRDRVVVQSGT